MVREDLAPAAVIAAPLHEELAWLQESVGPRRFRSAAREKAFEAWLHRKAMGFLRPYLPVLLGLYGFTVVLTLPKILFLTDAALQASDMTVYLWLIGTLGVDALLFALLAWQPRLDSWFWVYSPVVDVVMLTAVSLGVIAFQEPANVRIAMAILVVYFIIVFGTGMQRLGPCILIALLTFLLTAAGSHLLGLGAAFPAFAIQYIVIFLGMALPCHFMLRAHRLTFLQEQ